MKRLGDQPAHEHHRLVRHSGDPTTASTAPIRVGGLVPDDFTRRAQRYEAEIVAVEITPERPGGEDEPLLVDYATLASRHAVECRHAMEKTQRPSLKLIAGAGASAQDIVLGKLRVIAEGGKIELPSVRTGSTAAAIGDASFSVPAGEFDRAFLEEIFVPNTEELRSSADRLREQSKNPSLGRLAQVAAEILDFHLEIARAELADLDAGKADAGAQTR